MATNQETILRQWHMLRLVPRYPLKVTVQVIRGALRSEGFEVTDRTIQRDLNELSLVFPLTVDDREKPYGWSWQKDSPCFNLPGLSMPEALTLALAEQHLNALLPSSMVKQLKPHFDAAHQRLVVEPKPHRGRSWLDKVRTVTPTQPLISPKVLPEVQSVITEALLYERQVRVQYRKRGEKNVLDYRIHPLGLIQRGPMLYLYCRLFDYEDMRMLAMNRVITAELLEEASVFPKKYSLDDQVNKGVWGFGSCDKIIVTLLFEKGRGDHLLESPLSKDQQIEEGDAGVLKVKATVADTNQFRWWLMGLGDGVEVLAPANIRGEIKRTALAVLEKYKCK